MTRRLTAAVASAALVLVLAACVGSGTDPVTEPPPTVDIGGGPSDGGGEISSDGGGDETAVAAPDVPEPDPADFPGMDEETQEGAEQALRFYWHSVVWGYQTGRTDNLESLSGDNCETCQGHRSDIEEISKNGNFWVDVNLDELGTVSEPAGNFDVEVGYIFAIEEHEVLAESGQPSTEVPKQEYIVAAGMNWKDGAWVIDGLRQSEREDDGS